MTARPTETGRRFETLRRFETQGPEATEELARHLGAVLPPGALVTLDGDLGAGKTTFVRGLAAGLGCRDAVSSPTFARMHVYAAGARELELVHLDAWSARAGLAVLGDGAVEAMEGGAEGRSIAAVEWAERLGPWLPAPRIVVRLEHLAEDLRGVQIEVVAAAGASPAAGDLLPGLEAALLALPAEFAGGRELA